MDYADYRQSRDMTWRLLLKHDVTALPVRVGAICRAEGLTVISYHDADPLIRQYGLTAHAAENDGFTLGKIIFLMIPAARRSGSGLPSRTSWDTSCCITAAS